MDASREFSLIFDPKPSSLKEYFGPHVSPKILDLIISCHQNLQEKTQSLLHVTTNLDEIVSSRKVFMSAGGLAGCLYGIPVYKDASIHNLAHYILKDELPMFLRNQGRQAKVSGILAVPAAVKMGCTDYLSFGRYYLDFYNSSISMQGIISTKDHRSICTKQEILSEALYEVLSSSNPLTYKIRMLKEAVDNSYIARMLYFETALEYVLLFQNDAKAQRAFGQVEIYNKYAKDMVFSLNPALATRFSLKNFHSSPETINEYLLKKSVHGQVIVNYDAGHFYFYLTQRMQFYIRYYLLENLNNLRGHVLFRYFDIRPQLEELLAQKLWHEANKGGYSLLTYRMPKGEIGLLPKAKADFFLCDVDDDHCVQQGRLNLKTTEVLATKITAMRDPYTKK